MAKEKISARISKIAKNLLDEEKKTTGDSEGEILERCLYSCAKSPAALKIIAKGIEEDPNLKPLVDALFLAMQVRQTEAWVARESLKDRVSPSNKKPRQANKDLEGLASGAEDKI